MDVGLVLLGLLVLAIGGYLFARSDKLTALQFQWNRGLLRRVIGEARTARLLSPRFERVNVAYGRVITAALMVLGLVLVIAGLAR